MAIRPHSMEPVSPPLTALPEMPTVVKMPDGAEYNVAGDAWVLPEGPGISATVKIDWTLLTGVVFVGTSTSVMSARAVDFAKLYTLERMSAVRGSLKPKSAKDYLRAMLNFARCLAAHPEWMPVGRSFDWCDLTAEMFDAWLTIEYRKRRKGDSARLVRRFYVWGADPDASRHDFSVAMASVLSTLTLKGHIQGELVESRDKRRGPFNRQELELIFNACKTGAGTDQDRAIAWTLLETAIRPKQLYLLTNRDLEGGVSMVEVGDDGSALTEGSYQLRVRKIKHRGHAIKYHFLPLSEGCAKLLRDLQRPESRADDRLFWWISCHYSEFIRSRLKTFSEAADLHSSRLRIENSKPEGPLHELLYITPRRFRYAVATDRIARGDTPEDVAEMLGHKGTCHVYAYIETSPEIADYFQQATDYVIKPLIDLMEGRADPSEVNLLVGVVSPAPTQARSHIDAPIFWSDSDDAGRHYYRDQSRNQSSTGSSARLVFRVNKSETRIKELIERARRKFPLIYPGQDFNGQIWDFTHLIEVTNRGNAAHYGFTTLGSNVGHSLSKRLEDALPSYFADVIKSWMVISSNVSTACNSARIYATRYFWKFLSTRLDKNTTAFKWGKLSEDDILSFEQFLITGRTRRGEPLSSNSILSITRHTQRLIEFLAFSGICRHIDYVPQTRSPRLAATRVLNEKQLVAERKLPPLGVLETLAGMYHRFTTAPAGEVSDWILIMISAVAILMLTGLRIGELVTLPFDCEVEERLPKGRSGEPNSCRYGLRYWIEKTGNKTIRIKWISPTAESVVRASITRIKRLTAAARERARVLEADPTKVPLPPRIAGRAVITRPELLALIGQKTDDPVFTDPHKLLKQYGRGRESYYYVTDLEAYLLSRRKPRLYTIRHDDGTFQMFSESLFVIFAKQSRCRQMDACRLLVEPVTTRKIQFNLSSSTSFFETYGEVEPQSGLLANPHCFRHWLIHVAYKGGMETHLLLRYFAKRTISSVVDYLHFSTNESDAYAPDELRADRFYVPVKPLLRKSAGRKQCLE